MKLASEYLLRKENTGPDIECITSSKTECWLQRAWKCFWVRGFKVPYQIWGYHPGQFWATCLFPSGKLVNRL